METTTLRPLDLEVRAARRHATRMRVAFVVLALLTVIALVEWL